MTDDDHDRDPIIGGAAIPLPPGFLDALRAEHTRSHMRADSEEARLDRFLDGLDVDGLLAIRYMLGCSAETAYGNAMHYLGQVRTLLRAVHHVDPDTGEDPLAQDREAAQAERDADA